ncbi:MAG TPA: site-specific integrase [Phycisphaerae bacterium]|nr:site-specific integrase [Phycisphaerae bacterium]
MDLAGPRSRDNPEGPARDGLFGHDDAGGPRWAPRLKAPPERVEEPTAIFSLEEIGHWLEACQSATLPKLPGVDPAAWWRALVAFAYNTGLRIDTLVRVRWEHVEGRWLVVPAALMKRRRRGARIYLNRRALAAARSIRTDGEPRLFAWPAGLNQLHRARRRILDASRIEPRRRFGFHALRRALLSWLTARNPAVAKLQAGHVGGDVTLRYYVSPAIVGRFLERVPQPAVLEAAAPDPQQRLFV